MITLITNMDGARIEIDGANMTLVCSALELDLNETTQTCRLRGYGTTRSWTVFDWCLGEGSYKYKLAPASSSELVMIGLDEETEPQPLLSGSILTFENGAKLFLSVSDRKYPLDIQEFADGDYAALDRAVEEKTTRYWPYPGCAVALHVSKDGALELIRELNRRMSLASAAR